MLDEEVEEALARAECALEGGRGLRGTGFGRVVRAARHDPLLAARYAGRIASVDRRAFEHACRWRVRLLPGLTVLAMLSAAGAVLVVLAVRTGSPPPAGALLARGGRGLQAVPGFVPSAFLAGTGALLLGTHSLTHVIVGWPLGMRFTHVFLGGPPPPRPGVKVDYATYLTVSPLRRALMHASGAVVTKIVPFALLGASLRLDRGWPWLTWTLLALGILQISTDALLSTKSSDWMKVRRELRPPAVS